VYLYTYIDVDTDKYTQNAACSMHVQHICLNKNVYRTKTAHIVKGFYIRFSDNVGMQHWCIGLCLIGRAPAYLY